MNPVRGGRGTRTVLIVSVLLLTTSCVTTTLTPGGQLVRVTSNSDVVRPCRFIGEVKGADHMNGGLAGQGAAEENATRRLKNAAATMGANTVYLVTSTTNTSGSIVRGEAYACP